MATTEVALSRPPIPNWEGAAIRRAPYASPAVQAQTTFRLATTPRDRMAAFRLVYDKYVENRMLPPNPCGLRVTEFHLLETTAVFVAVRDGEVIGTVTLIGDGELGLPLDAVHPEVISDVRRRGWRMGEASCLAIRRHQRMPDLSLFIGLTRLIAQYARAQSMRQILLSCIPQHAQFYCRFLGFEQIGQILPYSTVCDTLGVACRLDFARINRSQSDYYDRYFGAPLPPSALINSPISDQERRVFASVIAYFSQPQLYAA